MMDAAGRERARKRATYAARTAGKMDAHVRADEVRQLAQDVLTLLDALDAAEARLAAVAQIIPRGAAESGGKATAEQVGYLRGMQHVHAQIRAVLAGERMPG